MPTIISKTLLTGKLECVGILTSFMFILIMAQYNDDNVIFIVRIGLRDGYDKNLVIESDHRQKNTPPPTPPARSNERVIVCLQCRLIAGDVSFRSGLAGPDYNEGLDPASSQ